MQVNKAYSQELKEIISISDAQEYLLSNPQQKLKTFYCPDEICREKYFPKITPVNLYNETPKCRAHFRRNPKDQHIEDCPYLLETELVEEIYKNRHKYLTYQNVRNLIHFEKIEDGLNIFDKLVIEKEPKLKENTENKISRKNPKIENIKKILTSYHTTSKFGKLINCFQTYQKEQLKNCKLTIGNESRRFYSQVFIFPAYFEDKNTYFYIINSNFSICSYNNGYLLTYPYPNNVFISGQSLTVSTYFSNAELQKYPCFEQQILQAKDKNWIFLLTNISNVKIEEVSVANIVSNRLMISPINLSFCEITKARVCKT